MTRTLDPSTFACALALAVALGSLHAFSVILAPLEQQVGASRTAISLVYSTSIVALTVGVLLSDILSRRLSASATALSVAVIGSLGLGLAAVADAYLLVLVGFGILFGGANGVGYVLFLREAKRAMPTRSGLAIGLATAAYAVGAMLFSAVFAALLQTDSARMALYAVAATVLGAGIAGWGAFDRSVAYATADPGLASTKQGRITVQLWLIYALGATGGLMAIAHAAGIVTQLGATSGLVAGSAIALALGNAGGSALGGALADRLSPRASLTLVSLVGGLCSLVLASTASIGVAVSALLGAGIAYGALIAVVPAVVDRLSAPGTATQVFGRVFTAWGVAGLLGPWIAGASFDWMEGYGVALLAAAGSSIGGAVYCYVILARAGKARAMVSS